MKILITTKLNGVGLESDANILNDRLTAMGHDVAIKAVNTPTPTDTFDLGIALEIPSLAHVAVCKKNVFIPNPEWFREEWIRAVSRYDEIWAKTQHGLNCFRWTERTSNYRLRLLGWTSRDMYDPSIYKNEKVLHLAGKSILKNTSPVCSTWSIWSHELPPLLIISAQKFGYSNGPPWGWKPIVSDAELNLRMNGYAFHLCPSAAEGWGHYIVEAMSTGAVVITTDAPPMNEIITPERGVLIPCKPGTVQAKYAGVEIRRMIPTPEAIRDGILRAQANPQLGEAARKWFLENDAIFTENLKEAINAINGNS